MQPADMWRVWPDNLSVQHFLKNCGEKRMWAAMDSLLSPAYAAIDASRAAKQELGELRDGLLYALYDLSYQLADFVDLGGIDHAFVQCVALLISYFQTY